MNALRRLVGAPGWVLSLWLLELALVAWNAAAPRAIANTAMGRHAALGTDRWLSVLIDVGFDHPELVVAALGTLAQTGIVALLGWVLLASPTIVRLSKRDTFTHVMAIALPHVPGLVVTSLWHVLLRAVLLAIVVMAALPLPPWAQVCSLAIALAFSNVALDLARVRVVLREAPRFHIRTAWLGFRDALTHAKLLTAGMALSLAQGCFVAAMVWIALAGLGSSWLLLVARGMALVVVVLGLWRIALAVEVTEPPREPPTS